MKNEANFWNRIVSALWSPTRVFMRVENGIIDGVPDGYYTIDGVSGWMELKCPSEPVRATTALFSGQHPLSISQRNWLLMHRQAGGVGWIAVETPNVMMLIGADHADVVNILPINKLLDIAAFSCERPVSAESWARFLETLTQTDYTP